MTAARQTVAIVFHLLRDQPWSEQVVSDIRAALAGARHLELKILDPEGDAARQVALLEELLTSSPAALIVLPVEGAAVDATLRRYRQARIPIVLLENESGSPDLYDALIVCDNVEFGRQMGRFFVETMGGRGDVVEIIGRTATRTSQDRAAGFREAIRGTAVRVVESVEGGWRAGAAREAFARALREHPRLDGVYAHNDEMACGAWDAAVEAHRDEELLITGIDALRGARGLQMVMQGRLAASLVNPSPGPAAAEAVLAILRGQPHMRRTVRRTALLRSNERIRSWQERRGAGP
jgi:ABC-type sugar transport system substrate-binding protein